MRLRTEAVVKVSFGARPHNSKFHSTHCTLRQDDGFRFMFQRMNDTGKARDRREDVKPDGKLWFGEVHDRPYRRFQVYGCGVKAWGMRHPDVLTIRHMALSDRTGQWGGRQSQG